MTTILVVFLGFLVGLALGFCVFRSKRSYKDGWNHGERFGRTAGYRQAWLKHNKFDQQQDWDEKDWEEKAK